MQNCKTLESTTKKKNYIKYKLQSLTKYNWIHVSVYGKRKKKEGKVQERGVDGRGREGDTIKSSEAAEAMS